MNVKQSSKLFIYKNWVTAHSLSKNKWLVRVTSTGVQYPDTVHEQN